MAKKLSKPQINKRVRAVLQEYLNNLQGSLEVEKTILFGSATRGEMHRDSDIDLIVISPNFQGMDFIKRLTLLTKLRRGMKRSAPMDIIGYTQKEFDRLSKESVVLAEAKEEGILISNF